MRRYILQRLLGALPILLGVVTLVFLLMRALPGDPAAMLAVQSGGSSSDAARLRAEYGLDRPLWQQYLAFLVGLVSGNLGRSLFTHQPVVQIIVQQAPATLSLACAAMGIAAGLGLASGLVGAAYPASWLDRTIMGLSLIGVSAPVSLSGLLLIMLFSLTLHWLPAAGQGTPAHLILPALAMGAASAGSITRVVRAQLDEVLNQEYIAVARAKGLSERALLLRHALRNALIPTITVIGMQFGFMLGGAAVTESVFARQGLGRMLIDAIIYQDYPVAQGIVLFSAAAYMLVNLLVDLAYGYLDPRIYRE